MIVVASMGAFIGLVGTGCVFITVYLCRRNRRRRQAETLLSSEILTPDQGLTKMALDRQTSDAEIRNINKSMRLLLPHHRKRVDERSTFWRFASSQLIGKLGFDHWNFDLESASIYSVKSCTFKVLNRSSSQVRVSIALKHQSAASFPPITISPVDQIRLEPDEASDVTVEVMPLESGPQIGFFAITPHTPDNASFAPYYLPFRIVGLPLATNRVPTYRWAELAGEGGTEIGRGAAGIVYTKVLQPGNRVVAVKKFNIDQATEQDLHDFVTETKTLSQYQHPCIVSFLGICTEFPNCALVLEYVRYGSLDRYVRPDVRTNRPPALLD